MKNFENKQFAGKLFAGRLFRQPARQDGPVFVPLGTSRIKVPGTKKRRKDTDDDVLMFLLR